MDVHQLRVQKLLSAPIIKFPDESNIDMEFSVHIIVHV